ncbi:MAG TPA: DinB family protein [Gemmatimonadales bacterium]|nr:DinB family protein [Gemmatimonadales bacterium]
MTPTLIARPGTDEYAPYYGTYIGKVPDGDLRAMLASQLAETLALIRSIPESRGGHRYAPDKWSIKGVLGHLADSERIFSYRALRIGRGDTTPLPGFEQDDYVPMGNFDARTLRDLADELAAVRQATLHLFAHLDQAAFERRGTASGKPVSVRALAYIIAGHELHHVGILKTRYLS